NDLMQAFTSSVQVITNAPGGGSSAILPFPVTTGNPAPTLSSMNPTSTTAGAAAFTLTLNGVNFIASSVVRCNGADRPTTCVSSTQLGGASPASDVASAGTPPVTVFNPSPVGGTSAPLTFTITASNNPVPGLTQLTPSSATAGSGAFTLTVTGTGFVNGAV